MRTIEDSRRPGPILPFEPLDPESVAANGGVPLIREFCSSPIPELRATDTNENVRRFELPEGSVGSTSAVTLFTGWTYRNASLRRRTDDEPLREHLLSLSTPAEFLLSDLFVHKDLAFARRASAHLYSQLPGAISYPNGPRSRGLLPMLEPIQDLSGCPVHPTTSEVSQYGRLVQKVIRRLGFSVNDFYGLRILLRYPPIPAMLVYRYELPEAP
jgi:hypothetical protein